MNGSAVTLDKVEIQISASAGKASENISQLTQTLSALRSATKGGFNNLSKLAESLEELKSASSDLKTVKENISSLTELAGSLKQLSDLPSPRGLGKLIENIQNIPGAFAKIDTKSLENVARVSNQLSGALTPLANKLGMIASGYSAVSKLADIYGVSITKVREYTKQSTNHMKNFASAMGSIGKQFRSMQKVNENFFKSLSKNTSSLLSKIKQIGLSLLGTRTIFTATRKAVSEYMNMDAELTWKVTNNWKALGAQLAPAIESVTWLFKQFIRVIYSVILALTGIDLIARANEKAMLGWGKAAKSTLGNLQKFDDLNVVEFPKGKGDDDSLIKLDTIDLSPIQKVIDWVRKLRDEIKEAWNSGQWEGVGTVLAEGLNGAIKAINFDYIEERFKTISAKFGDFLHGVVDNFDWSTFGTQLTRQLSLIPRMIVTFLNDVPWEEIGNGINQALTTFDPKFLIDSIFGAISSFVDGLQQMFLQIDGTVLGKKVSDGIVSVLENIGDILDKIDWKKLGTIIHDTIVNIDWASIWDSVVNAFKEAFNGINDFFSGLFGVNNGGGILAGILGGSFLLKEGGSIIELFTKIGDKASSLGTAFKLLGNNTLSTETISSITGVGKPLLNIFSTLGSSLPIIGAVIAGIVVLGTAIADLWKSNDDFRNSVTDLFNSIKSTMLPIIETLTKTLKDLWKGVVVPIFNLLVEVAKPIIVALVDVISVLWKNVLAPVVDVLNEILKQVLPPVIDVLKQIIDVVTWLWKNVLGPVVTFVSKVLVATIQLATGDIDGALETVSDAFLGIINAGKNLWTNIKDIFKKIADNISEKVDKIKKDWDKFWDNLKKSPKEMLQGLINTLNTVIGRINDKLSITLGSKTVALLKTLGVKNISEGKYQLFSIPKIPALNTGTNEIEYEGLYHLHPGESVVPKKYNPALGGGTNAETNERLDRVIYLLENFETTHIVNLGNKELLREQQKYNKAQNDKYGTDIIF